MTKPHLLYLSSDNCIKCRGNLPKIKDFCDEHEIDFIKRDAIKDCLDLVKKFNLRSVPVVILYKDTPEESGRFLCGDIDMGELTAWLKELES